MCGIRGTHGPQSHKQEQLQQAFDSISGRGPDDHEYQKIGDTTIGFHRLAIMDPTSRGNQPFTLQTDTKSIIRTCNGEIYNHIQLEQEHHLRKHCKNSRFS